MSFKRRRAAHAPSMLATQFEGHKQPKVADRWSIIIGIIILPYMYLVNLSLKSISARRGRCVKNEVVSRESRGGTSFHGGLPPQFRIPTPMSQMHSLELPHTF